MTSNNIPPDARCAALLLAVSLVAADAGATDVELGGHVKGRGLLEHLPGNSVLRPVAGSWAASAEADARLVFGARNGGFSFDADYQLFLTSGDGVRLARDAVLQQKPATAGALDDTRRWFDLTQRISDSGDTQLVHRLDRLTLSWHSPNTVVRFGRQALSWGGGLFFSPFDIVNPFDPAAVDTEYKTGDDMLYVQRLQSSGNDIQFAWVRRRNPVTDDVDADEATVALKYHGIAGDREYDLLVARNRGRATLGVGGNVDLGGAVLRGDLLAAEGSGWTVEGLVNLSYSWTAFGRNLSGALEYYYNGWGLRGDDYTLSDIGADPELAERLARGESFTIGRHYLAAGVTIELSPLWLVTPNLFANLDDPSALLQVVVNHSLDDNLTLLAALNVSLGPDGSEFGGIGAGGDFLSRHAGLFAQIGFYF